MDATTTQRRDAIDAVLRRENPGPDDVLAALALLAELRADLDRAERQLIAAARAYQTSWRTIAAALGLRSRQAAEQRWLRLRATATRDATTRDPAGERVRRRRQRYVDEAAGPEVLALREQVAILHDQVAARADWDGHEPAAGLARQTLAAAVEAPPGALYDLARLAINDLRTIPAATLGQAFGETLAGLARLAAAPGEVLTRAKAPPRLSQHDSS